VEHALTSGPQRRCSPSAALVVPAACMKMAFDRWSLASANYLPISRLMDCQVDNLLVAFS
jgi:hypothetical protein